jgi:hypothetical protein
MRLPLDPQFLAERERYSLKHCCEECVLFDARTAACAHEWPTEGHRRAYYDASAAAVIFCKEFELG